MSQQEDANFFSLSSSSGLLASVRWYFGGKISCHNAAEELSLLFFFNPGCFSQWATLANSDSIGADPRNTPHHTTHTHHTCSSHPDHMNTHAYVLYKRGGKGQRVWLLLQGHEWLCDLPNSNTGSIDSWTKTTWRGGILVEMVHWPERRSGQSFRGQNWKVTDCYSGAFFSQRNIGPAVRCTAGVWWVPALPWSLITPCVSLLFPLSSARGDGGVKYGWSAASHWLKLPTVCQQCVNHPPIPMAC